MGMSASQARALMLTARKSNLEFEGQQINQQRTTLSNSSSALQNSLLNLEVPTAPSSSQFTKTAYTYKANGMTYSIASAQYQSAAYTDPNNNSYPAGTYIVGVTSNVPVSKGEASNASIFTKIIHEDGSTTYSKTDGPPLKAAAVNADGTEDDAEYAKDVANIAKICEDAGIKDANGLSYGQDGYETPEFLKYESNGETKYVLKSDLDANATVIDNYEDGDDESRPTPTLTSNYIVNDNATSDEPTILYGAQVIWTDSNRMAKIIDKNGVEYQLSASTKTDDAAYNDAMNEYEYQKDLYNQGMNNINAKIDIIQEQDKSLELKLKSIDTEHNAVQTEIDAVKKVIDKNVETSFKTFQG